MAQSRIKIGMGGPCRDCGSAKAIWTIGHPDLMTRLFGLGRTENVRLCIPCIEKYQGITSEELDEILAQSA